MARLFSLLANYHSASGKVLSTAESFSQLHGITFKKKYLILRCHIPEVIITEYGRHYS